MLNTKSSRTNVLRNTSFDSRSSSGRTLFAHLLFTSVYGRTVVELEVSAGVVGIRIGCELMGGQRLHGVATLLSFSG